MTRLSATCLLMLAVLLPSLCNATQTWTQGTHYDLISPVQHTSVAPGKVEVMEVFSYGCIACNGFQPVMATIEHNLPRNAQMVLLHAAFLPNEGWPTFQRAYYAAQALGISNRTHQAMFDAVWKTGELAIVDPTTHRLKNPLPSIEDVAKCYKLTGIKTETFLATAKSFGVDNKMKLADAQVTAMQVPGTPCLVVAGKYRINMDAMNSPEDLIGIIHYLVDKETRH